MNMVQMTMLPMNRMEGNEQAGSPFGVSGRGFGRSVRQDKSTDSFSRVFDDTLKKTETGKPQAGPSETGKLKACQSETGKPEVSQSGAGKPEACQQMQGTKMSKQPVEYCSNQEPEISSETSVIESNEANMILISQMADILKLVGIPVDENSTLSQNGDAVQDSLNQQDQAEILPLTPNVKEAVLRIIKMLGKLNGEGDNGDVTAFLQELKGLTELSELNSLPDQKFLAKLIKVLEKALGEHPARKTDLTSAAAIRTEIPLVETVSRSSSEKKVMESVTFTDSLKNQTEAKVGDANGKGPEGFGSETGQNARKGFSFRESDIINPRDVRSVVSGNGFTAVTDVLENGQQVPVNKLAQNIFGQIAQKAKVIVLPEVTEMQIQLKPGFLGKLNMSISSENGTVTARFSAETQAVKAIIETNLNSLRDTLNQQGIKVDQLVVDIGTQNHRPGFDQRQSMYRGHNGSKNNRVSISMEEADRMFSTEAQSGALKDYYGSTVEFTA